MQNVSFKLKRVHTLNVLSHIFRANITKNKKGGTVGEKCGLTVDILNRHCYQLKHEEKQKKPYIWAILLLGCSL